MLPILFAQLIEPPLQPSPVRLPEARPTETRPTYGDDKRILVAPAETRDQGQNDTIKSSEGRNQVLQEVLNLTVYNENQLKTILNSCFSVEDPRERLDQCAAALTAQFRADGFINSRVYVSEEATGAVLIAKEGILSRWDILAALGERERDSEDWEREREFVCFVGLV